VNTIRARLTYANVMSSIAVFLVLGGATAFAAQQLGKKTVGTKQLKSNAVSAAKLKKNAVTTVKIKDAAVTGPKLAANSVTGDKIADGSVTGADINSGTVPYSQVVARIRGNSALAATGTPQVMQLSNPTYTQPAGEDDSYTGAVDFTFAPTCTTPRSGIAYLSIDSPTPGTVTPEYLIGLGQTTDSVGGTVSKRAEIGPFPGLGAGTRFGPNAPTPRTVSLLVFANCNSGSGVTATFAGVDVIGTK
jgi:hypothetical protein